MKPIFKYHSIILTITVSAMYLAFSLTFSVKNKLPSVPFALEIALAIILSIGVYKLSSSLLNVTLLHCCLIKKLVHGNEYMHGTWVGFFHGNNEEKRIYVEHFQQDLEGLTISGTAYTEDDQRFAQWCSEPATIEARKGRLIYSYTSDVLYKKETRQGLGVFQFYRENLNKPPTELKGYVVDLDQGKRLPSEETKISDKLLSIKEALSLAKRLTN